MQILVPMRRSTEAGAALCACNCNRESNLMALLARALFSLKADTAAPPAISWHILAPWLAYKVEASDQETHLGARIRYHK